MEPKNLLSIFENTKDILCRYDYYVQTSKRIFKITNTEDRIPHLMGLQYIGPKGKYTGDKGTYLIKKKKLKYSSIEKRIRKYYKGTEKQNSALAMVYGKIDNLYRIRELFSSEAAIYLYEKVLNPDSELDTDYLLVCELQEIVIQIGIVAAGKGAEKVYHCNTFLIDYRSNNDYDLHYRNLKVRHDIRKVTRQEKMTGISKVTYLSEEAASRERIGINKMLKEAGKACSGELVEALLKLNCASGQYHTIDMINKLDVSEMGSDVEYQNAIKNVLDLWER